MAVTDLGFQVVALELVIVQTGHGPMVVPEATFSVLRRVVHSSFTALLFQPPALTAQRHK
eukprot:1160048-Pelagomonas_calceolata.AAC.8